MSDHPSAVSGAFNRPFPEQIAFFRRKLGNLVPTQAWDDLLGAQHDNAFMVAGAAKADLLNDLAAAVDKAISEGRGIEDFRKDFRAIVKRNGWTGWTGEGSVKGEAWRVKTILRTNAQTSYAAGRYAQLVAGNFPLWVYRHGGSQEPRPQHIFEWNGLVLPPDHPFWRKAYPPSDWGCSCYVLGARSEAGAKRLGGDPKKRLRGDWAKPDPKTGAPAGIGRGWDYAPGASVVELVRALAEKVRNWDYAIAKAFMVSLPSRQASALSESYRALPTTADDARRYARRVYEPQPALPDLPPVRTMGLVGDRSADQIDTLTGIDVRKFDFRFDEEAVRHVLAAHGSAKREELRGQKAIAPDDFGLLPQILGSPDAIDRSGQSAIGETIVVFRKRIGGVTYFAAMRVSRRRETIALKTFYARGK